MDLNNVFISAFADEAGDDISTQIKAMQNNNIKGIEIRGVNGKNIADISISEVKELNKQLVDNEITVWSIGSPIGKSKITDDFTPELEKYKKLLDFSGELNATRFRLFSFFETNGGDDCFGEVSERLSTLCELAKPYKIVLCHENEKDIYGDIVERCVKIHETVPEIKAVFDPANFIQCGQNTLDAWTELKQYVDYIHIKDARISDKNVVPAGCGDGNIKELLTDYFASGKNHVTLEPHLSEFTGLSGLEGEGNKSVVGQSEFLFENQYEAFEAGADYLNRLLEEL